MAKIDNMFLSQTDRRKKKNHRKQQNHAIQGQHLIQLLILHVIHHKRHIRNRRKRNIIDTLNLRGN